MKLKSAPIVGGSSLSLGREAAGPAAGLARASRRLGARWQHRSALPVPGASVREPSGLPRCDCRPIIRWQCSVPVRIEAPAGRLRHMAARCRRGQFPPALPRKEQHRHHGDVPARWLARGLRGGKPLGRRRLGLSVQARRQIARRFATPQVAVARQLKPRLLVLLTSQVAWSTRLNRDDGHCNPAALPAGPELPTGHWL